MVLQARCRAPYADASRTRGPRLCGAFSATPQWRGCMAVPERFRIGSFAHPDAQDHLSRSAVMQMASNRIVIRVLTTTEPSFLPLLPARRAAGLQPTDLHD